MTASVRALLPLTLAALLAAPVPAQAWRSVDAPGTPRAALPLPGGRVAVALYEADAVELRDATGAVVARQEVGDGPAAMALSADSRRLAVAARLGNEVALLDPASLDVLARAATGDRPAAITALPSGGFATANSFGDSITLVDADGAAVTMDAAGSVPNAIAATADFLVVATRAPSRLSFYRPGARTPESTVDLPDSARALTATAPGTVAVLFDGRVALYGPAGPKAGQDIAGGLDLAFADARIHVLTGDELVVFDANLEEFDRVGLPVAARALGATGGAVALAAPLAGQVAVRGLEAMDPASAPRPLAAEPATPAPEAPAETPEPEPEPVAEPEPAPIELAPAEPTPAPEPAPGPPPTPEPPASPVPDERAPELGVQPEAIEPGPAPVRPVPELDEPEPAEPDPRGPAPEPEPGEPVAEGYEEPAEMERPVRYREAPMAVTDVRAPSPRRPSPGISIGVEEPSFSDIFSADALFGLAEPVFEFPEAELADVVQADEIRTGPDFQYWEAVGNVRIVVGDLTLTADHIIIDREERYYRAIGDVALEQQRSRLVAGNLKYTLPPDPEDAAVISQEEAFRAAFEGDPGPQGEVEALLVRLTDPAREFEAEYLRYDFATQTGEAVAAKGQAGPLFFGAARLDLTGPESAVAEDVWLTTCDCEHDYYRIRVQRAEFREGQAVIGEDANLQVLDINTPIYWPRWAQRTRDERRTINVDFDSGRRAGVGYYVNLGQQFAVSPHLDLGYRLYPTEKAGVGVGIEGGYDYMSKPASPLYRTRGEFRTLYTTKDRGYLETYNEYAPTPDWRVLTQWEQWSDDDIIKDFYYEQFRNRTEPRTFANATYTRPGWLATATYSPNTHDFVSETERLPEATYALLERQLVEDLYVTYDVVAGYNEREPAGTHAARLVNVGRLTWDLDIAEAVSLTPFTEMEGTFYSRQFREDDSDFRFSSTFGVTAQTRLHKAYDGLGGFSGFKHIVLPSITYSYRPEPTMGVEETPRFDALDNVYGRSRIEAKLDNIVFGRDAESGDVWQVGRLSLFLGEDLANELRKSSDYEIELDLRPRPWWGALLVAEHHRIEEDRDLDEPFFVESLFLEAYERFIGEPFDPEVAFQFNANYGDYDRILTYLYYDDRAREGRFNARLGFAYTETLDRVFNREVLYGIGYRLSEKWSVAFEHRYDFERDELMRQEYEIRRDFDCLEGALIFRDRPSGWDVNVGVSVVAFPGTGVTF